MDSFLDVDVGNDDDDGDEGLDMTTELGMGMDIEQDLLELADQCEFPISVESHEAYPWPEDHGFTLEAQRSNSLPPQAEEIEVNVELGDGEVDVPCRWPLPRPKINNDSISIEGADEFEDSASISALLEVLDATDDANSLDIYNDDEEGDDCVPFRSSDIFSGDENQEDDSGFVEGNLQHRISQGSSPSTVTRQTSSPLKSVSGNRNSGRVNTMTSGYINDRQTPSKCNDINRNESLVSCEMNSASASEAILVPPKLQWLPPKVYIPGPSTMAETEEEIPHKMTFSKTGLPRAIVRPAFPVPVKEDSPILGVSNRKYLRTCFRIGEAINAAVEASRTIRPSSTVSAGRKGINAPDAIIELYARVISSARHDWTQTFLFADLFTDKPPYLHGVYKMWKGVALWDSDSKVFLTHRLTPNDDNSEGGTGGKMCRVLGRIRHRDERVNPTNRTSTTGTASPCQMNRKQVYISILCIWACAWADVGIAKGIACS